MNCFKVTESRCAVKSSAAPPGPGRIWTLIHWPGVAAQDVFTEKFCQFPPSVDAQRHHSARGLPLSSFESTSAESLCNNEFDTAVVSRFLCCIVMSVIVVSGTVEFAAARIKPENNGVFLTDQSNKSTMAHHLRDK
ncbi:hypothetical protein JOB18_006462 [Solea senegalensis]|uniref:Uncharacterized protein n=1 Tax=Solea senegalensis TaxID=28829 RepID=A0AAV6SJY6_SOLSE|nr:hypothetical protein JOB18_006462 [Solea senegalensis]